MALTSWKKKVALLACKAACESASVAVRLVPFWAARVGVAESFLMSYIAVSAIQEPVGGIHACDVSVEWLS